MKFLAALLVSFSFFKTSAQISNIQTLQGQIIKENDIRGLAEGSPYLIDEFTEGYITYPEKTFKGVFMRYNLYKESFEMERETGEIIELRMDGILKLGFDRKRPEVFGVEMISIDNVWYQELIPDRFYKFSKTTIVEDAQPGYNTAERRKRFVTQTQYFITDSNLILSEINLKKKEIQPLLTNQEKTNKYIKSNRLKYTKEEDVIKIIAFDTN
ncbi:hypothetical protein [Ekhidna sp. To15]|uniref:hypothetical protein n=1 Tax=Ekhidna sp. To15 TaxID=3395267 RepID=UPI003F51D399